MVSTHQPKLQLQMDTDTIPSETASIVFFASVEVFQVRGHSDIFLGNDDKLVNLIGKLLFASRRIFSWCELSARWGAGLFVFAIFRSGGHDGYAGCIVFVEGVGVGVCEQVVISRGKEVVK